MKFSQLGKRLFYLLLKSFFWYSFALLSDELFSLYDGETVTLDWD